MAIENESTLASWIMEKVDAWEEWRDSNYSERWDEYYRLWRGIWTDADKSRNGERSRIICPELSQTVETMVAELEDATFIRERWVDVADDVGDEDPQDVSDAIDLLLQEFESNGVPQAISESYFNGALYGTGIAMVAVDKIKIPTVSKEPIPSVTFKEKFVVKVLPISPRNFVIDPSAKSVEEALGCARVLKIPLTHVQKKINDGIYRSIPLSPYDNNVEDLSALGEYDALSHKSEAVKIVEWHGLVPKNLLSSKENLFDKLEKIDTLDTEIEAIDEGGSAVADTTLVEAIVTIVNDAFVARAVENPFLMGDRSIVAYQHDTVPNRFWGRGVAEKGYNPQKALDAEIRARIDALGLSTHPMMAIDATKIPRGETFAVRPGRNILTNGSPAEALLPLKFPPPDPHTFQQTQELREMIQRGTGGYELPANVEGNRMAATSMSMVVGSMIKRSRRTLANIEREFLKPLVEKALWRYMQFNPELFPMRDYKFRVKATMGIMAREFEQGQLVSLLSTVPGDSPAFWMLLRGIYSNSNIDGREFMVQYADQMLQNALNPPPPQPQPPDAKTQVEMERLNFEKNKWLDQRDLETRKLQQLDEGIKAEARRDIGEGKMQSATAELQMVKAETEKLRSQAETVKMIAEAQKMTVEAKLSALKVQVEMITAALNRVEAIKVPSMETVNAEDKASSDDMEEDATEEETKGDKEE